MNEEQKIRWAAISGNRIGDLSHRDATRLLAVINNIDDNTEWEDLEPAWWLDMMKCRAICMSC